MNAQFDIDIALKIWDLVTEETNVYIAYILDGDTAEICIESSKKKKTKILKVFLSHPTAEKYASHYKSKSIVKIGSIEFGNLCKKLSEVYADEDPEITVSCVLTSTDTSGTLYNIDTLWTLNSH